MTGIRRLLYRLATVAVAVTTVTAQADPRPGFDCAKAKG